MSSICGYSDTDELVFAGSSDVSDFDNTSIHLFDVDDASVCQSDFDEDMLPSPTTSSSDDGRSSPTASNTSSSSSLTTPRRRHISIVKKEESRRKIILKDAVRKLNATQRSSQRYIRLSGRILQHPSRYEKIRVSIVSQHGFLLRRLLRDLVKSKPKGTQVVKTTHDDWLLKTFGE